MVMPACFMLEIKLSIMPRQILFSSIGDPCQVTHYIKQADLGISKAPSSYVLWVQRHAAGVRVPVKRRLRRKTPVRYSKSELSDAWILAPNSVL